MCSGARRHQRPLAEACQISIALRPLLFNTVNPRIRSRISEVCRRHGVFEGKTGIDRLDSFNVQSSPKGEVDRISHHQKIAPLIYPLATWLSQCEQIERASHFRSSPLIATLSLLDSSLCHPLSELDHPSDASLRRNIIASPDSPTTSMLTNSPSLFVLEFIFFTPALLGGTPKGRRDHKLLSACSTTASHLDCLEQTSPPSLQTHNLLLSSPE